MPAHTKRTIGTRSYVVSGKQLSEREKRIACLFALGYDRNYIATEMGCAVKTVDSHRLNILAKLGLDSTVAICRHAIEHSWVPVPGACSICGVLATIMDNHHH